jgi:transcriptional regulator with XRE-family HTH domain
MKTKPLGPRLKKLRKAKGWTLYRATRDLDGVTPQQLQNLEDGLTPPWNVRCKTMFALVKQYTGLKIGDFRPPG